MPKTIQLRRYQITPGRLDEFRDWVSQQVLPIRAKFGFGLEFMYFDTENSEFIWAASVEGDQNDFLEKQSNYDHSPERAEAGRLMPDCLVSVDTRFVESH